MEEEIIVIEEEEEQEIVVVEEDIEYIAPTTQEKTITPTKEQQIVVPDEGVFALSKVTVKSAEYIYNDGVKSEYDRFWDNYQDYGNRTDYTQAFSKAGWNNETYKPKYIPKPHSSAVRMFEDTRITRLDLTNLDTTELLTGGTNMFTSNYIEYLEIDIPKCTALASSLYYMRGLKTLIVHNSNQCLFGALIHAFLLENVTIESTIGGEYFEMVSSNLVTYESLQNIIKALYDYATNPDGNTHRLGLHKEAKAKLTDTDIAEITQKGWTLT